MYLYLFRTILLLCILLCTVVIAFHSTLNHDPFDASQGRVVDEVRTQFQTYKKLETQSGTFLVEHPQLALGAVVTFKTETPPHYFSVTEPYDRYWVGQGVEGKMTIASLSRSVCDWWCSIIQFKKKLRDTLQNT